MCQKINHEVECMRLKGLFKYIPKIAEFLVRNYSLKEINFILGLNKMDLLFNAEHPEMLLHVDELYNNQYLIAELRNTLNNIINENKLRPLENLKEIYKIIET